MGHYRMAPQNETPGQHYPPLLRATDTPGVGEGVGAQSRVTQSVPDGVTGDVDDAHVSDKKDSGGSMRTLKEAPNSQSKEFGSQS